MSKTVIESKITNENTVIDGQTGEVLQYEQHTQTGTKTIRTAEPAYVKLYIDDILYMADIPKALSPLVYELAKRASYANEEDGMCVSLTAYVKDKICETCNWANKRIMNNYLTKLAKADIIKRLGQGTYQLNPYLFGRGEWKDIEKIRMTWNYDSFKGKTVKTDFTYKQEIENNEDLSDMLTAAYEADKIAEQEEYE